MTDQTSQDLVTAAQAMADAVQLYRATGKPNYRELTEAHDRLNRILVIAQAEVLAGIR